MDESKKLKEYWYSDGWIDYEYKKYTLLAYLQQADVFFKQSKIYPVLSELIKHYNHLNHYKSKKDKLENKLNNKVTKLICDSFQEKKNINQILITKLPEFLNIEDLTFDKRHLKSEKIKLLPRDEICNL